MPAHSLPVECGPSGRSRGFWASQPNGDLVVFVHGFNGDATRTWRQFPGVFLASKEGMGADVIFYGYDSIGQGAEESGVELHAFLNDLMSSETRQATSPQCPVRPEGFCYKRLFLVAHSLGAVVARQCLLEQTRAPRAWTVNIRLVLFAPAHRGAEAASLLRECVLRADPVSRLLIGAGLLRAQAIRDLQPGSAFLSRLEAESKVAISAGCDYHKAWSVQWAAGDAVVINQRFAEDPTAVRIVNTSHVGICKPSSEYLRPYEVVWEALR